ncbi:L-fucose isomerase [Streptococcus pneumoniae]|nr:L-fucose isomerase [Streptococcus pneumoniae]
MIQHPRIGIRPTIDGRRQGVRESLEVQTMNMAKSVADLISSTLKYPDGEPVECVISPSTIGRVPEAAASHELFKKSNVCATITVTPCWCYGSETMDMSPDIPHAILGFNGTERPGAVYLAAVLASHAQKGIPAFGIYGRDVQEASDTDIPEDVKEKLLRYARAALATGLMRDTAYLSMGSVSMGIGGSIVNPDFFQEYLGMRNESVDMTEFTRRMDRSIYDPEEFERALKWVKENVKEGFDHNREDLVLSREEKDRQWEFVIKMFMIGRDLMVGNPRLAELGFEEEAVGHHALVAGFQGQRQWTDHFPNGDFMETFLNTQFDWNGIRKPFVFATENDSLNGVSMLFNYLLTNTPLWELEESEVQAMLENTDFPPANREYFRGGGFSTRFLTKGDMPVTMVRLNLLKGVGPVLQIAEGYTLELPEDVHHTLDNRTDPGWPTTWFAPRLTGKGAFKSVYDVMNNWGANHGAITYGHIGADLITLASMLRIPVNMHNVPEEDIFRPKNWSLFGTEDLESADYRACQLLGPLHK